MDGEKIVKINQKHRLRGKCFSTKLEFLNSKMERLVDCAQRLKDKKLAPNSPAKRLDI